MAIDLEYWRRYQARAGTADSVTREELLRVLEEVRIGRRRHLDAAREESAREALFMVDHLTRCRQSDAAGMKRAACRRLRLSTAAGFISLFAGLIVMSMSWLTWFAEIAPVDRAVQAAGFGTLLLAIGIRLMYAMRDSGHILEQLTLWSAAIHDGRCGPLAEDEDQAA